MVIQNFSQLDEMAHSGARKMTVGVINGEDENALLALRHADELVNAVLFGNPALIGAEMDRLGISRSRYRIESVSPGENPVMAAAECIRTGEVDMLMKGKISTGELFKGIFSHDADLRSGERMSHLVFKEIPGSRKLISITDGALTPVPTCEEKKQILRNALGFLHGIGYECPNVAALCAVEKVSPKMQETIDAAELKQAWQRGEFPGCNFEGPISYDLAVSPRVAELKGFQCPWCGDFDLFLVPSVVVGNILGKCLVYTAHARMGSIVLGCRVPVIMGSRGASSDDKYNSIALGVVFANLRHPHETKAVREGRNES